jgi:hypothetical protein
VDNLLGSDGVSPHTKQSTFRRNVLVTFSGLSSQQAEHVCTLGLHLDSDDTDVTSLQNVIELPLDHSAFQNTALLMLFVFGVGREVKRKIKLSLC